ncbi:MAG TPA: ABC transporter [Acidimicrobiaceae bacterium]|nr:ABC transporter [Acidimicrobiaceae bacterium]
MGSAGGSSSELRIISARRSIPEHLREIWEFRELLGGLIRKELKVRYKNSVLGFAWSMAQPAFLLAVYTFVFSVLGQGFQRFSIWLLCGLIVWTLVSTTLVTAVQAITVNANLVGKVPFPRAVLPLSTFGSAFVHFLLQFATFMAIVAIARHPIDWAYVWMLPLAVLALSLLLAALALMLSVVNVYARDTQHLLELALIAMFWANPIIYEYQRAATWFSQHSLPTWLPLLNPFTAIVTTFQRAIYGASSVGDRQLLPDVGQWWYLRNIGIIGAVSLGLLALALWYFDRAESNLAEIL